MILCSTKNFEILVRLRERIYTFLTLRLYFPFCMYVYKGRGACFPLSTMLEAPKDSLAFRTGMFLKSKQLEPMPGYEEHDMKHALLGYAATLRDEIAMQYFEWANGNRSLPVITVLFCGTLIMPEEYRSYRDAYQRGKRALPLSKIRLKEYALQNMDELREKWKIDTANGK